MHKPNRMLDKSAGNLANGAHSEKAKANGKENRLVSDLIDDESDENDDGKNRHDHDNENHNIENRSHDAASLVRPLLTVENDAISTSANTKEKNALSALADYGGDTDEEQMRVEVKAAPVAIKKRNRRKQELRPMVEYGVDVQSKQQSLHREAKVSAPVATTDSLKLNDFIKTRTVEKSVESKKLFTGPNLTAQEFEHVTNILNHAQKCLDNIPNKKTEPIFKIPRPKLQGKAHEVIDLESGEITVKQRPTVMGQLMSKVSAEKKPATKMNVSIDRTSQPSDGILKLRAVLRNSVVKKRLEKINENKLEQKRQEAEEKEEQLEKQPEQEKQADMIPAEDEDEYLVLEITGEEDGNEEEDVEDEEEQCSSKSEDVHEVIIEYEKDLSDEEETNMPASMPIISQIPITQAGDNEEETELELMELCSGVFDRESAAPPSHQLMSSDDDEGQEESQVAKKKRINGKLAKPLQLSSDSEEHENESADNKPCLSYNDDNLQKHSDKMPKEKEKPIDHNNDDDDIDEEAEIERILHEGHSRSKRFLAQCGYEDGMKFKGFKEDDTDDEEYEEQEEQDEDINVDGGEDEPPRHMRLANFIDEEAELSESEWGSADEEEDENQDHYELELGDEEEFDGVILQDQLEKIHIRKVQDDDARELRHLKELLLKDEERDGVGRQRRFKWKNSQGGFSLDETKPGENADEEADSGEEEKNEYNWRKIRFEREELLRKKRGESAQIVDDENSPSNGRVVIVGNEPAKPTHARKFARASFLKREPEILSKMVGTKKSSTLANDDDEENVTSVKTGSNFVFRTITPEQHNLTKKRKAESLDDQINDNEPSTSKGVKQPKRSNNKCLIDDLV